MLQRQGSNANSYQWWWVSHIRTKQSKWLEQDLQDMEVKVKSMMKLIEEDADSFAKRAELYFKKRPELINFVEEFYRAYRALAEKYDHISGELHSANSTIATVLADKVKLPIDEEIEENSVKISSKTGPVKSSNRSLETPQTKILRKDAENSKTAKKSVSGLKMNRGEAGEETKRMQKKIMVLENEKGFVKCSYENSLAKYWEIEKQIIELQEQVCCLQEELELGLTVKDEEVQALMAAGALKSCGEMLARLQEQQQRSEEEAWIESKRVRDSEEKLKFLKFEFFQDEEMITGSTIKNLGNEVSNLKQEKMELQEICQKIREHLELDSDKSFTVAEFTEKMDELVNKVTELEIPVSMQVAQIERLRSENNNLQKHLKELEKDMMLVDDSKSLNDKIRGLEEELQGVKALNHSVDDQKKRLQNKFSEACHNLDVLAEKLQISEKQEAIEDQAGLNLESEKQSIDPEAIFDSESVLEIDSDRKNTGPNPFFESETILNFESGENNKDPNPIFESQTKNTNTGETVLNFESQTQIDGDIEELVLGVESKERIGDAEERDLNVESQKQNELLEEDLHDLHHLLLERMDDREKLLLAEYTSILRNYKETKRRLSELEKKNEETMAMKDMEIQSLRQKLCILPSNSDQEFQNPASDDRLELQAEAHQPDQEVISELPIFKSFGDRNPEFTRRKDESNAGTEEEVKVVHIDAADPVSTIEEKFRRDIDESLEENLRFWLRFTASFYQIQKFQVTLQDLQAEFLKLTKEHKRPEGSGSAHVAKPEALLFDKSLRELQGELATWLDQNVLLKEELQCRLSSLGRIREEICRVSMMGGEDGEGEFTSYQAGKFQGEVLGMQQENKKVEDELQAGMEHVRGLQFEVEKTMQKLHENFEMPEIRGQPGVRQTTNKKGIPLRSFIFGVKPKKPSIFSCMNPAMQKQFSDLRAGFPM